MLAQTRELDQTGASGRYALRRDRWELSRQETAPRRAPAADHLWLS